MTDEDLIVDLNRLFWLLEEDRQYLARANTARLAARRIQAQAAEIERLRGDLAKAVEALQIARVHVANNSEGWSVSRAPSRDDLTIVDLVLAALTGAKT